MSDESNQFMPYAAPANVVAILSRLRQRGLPAQLTSTELTRIGIPAGSTGKTLQALRFFGFIDADGNRTQSLSRIGRAATAEYPTLLAEVLKAAYSKVFQIVDPAEAQPSDLEDAFRHYEPRAQCGRMTALFVGLCREAGLMPGEPAPQRTRPKRFVRKKPILVKAPEPLELPEARPNIVSSPFVFPAGSEPARQLAQFFNVLVGQIPADGKWPKSVRDQWIQTFESGLDLFVRIESEK